MLEKEHLHRGKHGELQVREFVKNFNYVSKESNIAYKQIAFFQVRNYDKARGRHVTSRADWY